MTKIVNGILSFFKMFLLLISFVFTFYIVVNMYRRLEKNVIDAIFNFVPFLILFLLFSINFIFKQKSVNNCLFYNVTCCLAFTMILFVIYRTLFDRNMIAMIRLGYDINFNYFADIIAPMRAILYMLCLSNVLLIVSDIKLSIKTNDNISNVEVKNIKTSKKSISTNKKSNKPTK